MTNNKELCEAILGLMRVSMFGEVAGEDIVSGLESSKSLWKAIVPGSNIGTEHQTRNAAKGELFFDELRILTSKADYLDLYSLCLIWRPSFLGVSFVEIEEVELVMMWES
jgi:hypothetical protein